MYCTKNEPDTELPEKSVNSSQLVNQLITLLNLVITSPTLTFKSVQ